MCHIGGPSKETWQSNLYDFAQPKAVVAVLAANVHIVRRFQRVDATHAWKRSAGPPILEAVPETGKNRNLWQHYSCGNVC